MGVITKAVRAIRPTMRDVASTIPMWQSGTAQLPGVSYETYARDGYQKNEIVFACIEELATSAAEPRIVGKRLRPRLGTEEVSRHPILDLLNHPNPFLTRFQLWATVIMHLYLSGNAYIEKVRSEAGNVVELWLMRPDRVRVVPDRVRYIGGYEYRIGAEVFRVDARDVIHFKTRHPLDDFYGMPPLMAASGRVDIDNYMRDFVKSFFMNAGVPAGMLSVKSKMTDDDKAKVRSKFRADFTGARGWHELMIIDNTEATYTPLTMQLGQRGLVIPELDEIVEARTAMVFGVPLSLIGARLGMASSSYANRKSDREAFWDETLAPLYRMLAETLDTFLVPEFEDIDEVLFDLADVHALQEDIDKIHKRVRDNVAGGLITIEEGRAMIGEEGMPATGTIMLPSNMVTMPVHMLGMEMMDGGAGTGAMPAGDGDTEGMGDQPIGGE